MSTPLGQLGAASATKAADVELIESQLMNNPGATLPGRDMGAVPAPRADPGALPTALPPAAFPAPMRAVQYGMPAHSPPAVPPPHRGALDEYAFPVSMFIVTVLVLSPYVQTLMKRFLPPAAQSTWATVVIRALLVTLGFMILDKLNQ